MTVYHEDDDDAALWHKIAGIGDDRIIRIATSDNIWALGDSGRCGPCSEILYGHGDHIVGIGGFNCVTLGHHYEHPVVKHYYFCSQKVIDDLKMFQGFRDVLVVIQHEYTVRGEDKWR